MRRNERTSKWLLVAAFLALSSVALSACGGSDKAGASGGGGKDYNQTDAAFAAGMLPHHMGGVQLGKLAVQKGVNPKVKSIGQDIVDAQTRESGTLRRFVKTFGAGQPVMPGPIDERDMMDMKKLQQASGSEFDRMWIDVISGHHAAAIQMAEIEKAGGQNPQAKQLAASIIDSQSGELTQFNMLSRQMGG